MFEQTKHQVQSTTLPLELGREASRAIMETYSPQQLPPAGRWHYHQGVFLVGLTQLWQHTGELKYLLYMKDYVDHLVDDSGNLLLERGELDSVQAGLLLFELDAHCSEARYRRAADKLLHLLYTQNRTTEGGYWHKDRYPYQMWLDGLYMGGVFTMKYASQYEQPRLFDDALFQEQLMRAHTYDAATGLYYHAWDERRSMPWANPSHGRSPVIWGRSLGWYALSLVEFLDLLPQEHPGRLVITPVFLQLCEAIVTYQDPRHGLWYQVMDKGEQADNWPETSCSSLFIYTLAKGVRLGYLDPAYLSHAQRGYQGLLQVLYFNEQGHLVMPDICIGTGVGDYKHYVERPKCENDLHGVGALIMACIELGKS
ncbi:unsaturated rhamnogalacturonyl hydrolase [Paenibacillus sp. JCM 10914]|uniref:glycoside hydrolase family 88/105 protein n=1 Tax=Paenibacillus sp. JCM 10914 TaxID=1236974 RepID=UPI0003CC30C8|nr:glycoside hydrolase family 88 protein [Paenibacillus sp. JCM 10914]GAE04847.1 rhamnogalacturonides degradation protein RhiN [Paenibacillus sp. JCM 10914]